VKSCSLRSTGAAAREVLFELRRIRESLVEPEELTETQSYLVGVFPYTMQTIGDLAKRLETLAVFGLPDDYYTRHLERIASVTREDILDVARRHVDPERVAIVAVGPADALEPQLQGLGPVAVGYPQAEPQLVSLRPASSQAVPPTAPVQFQLRFTFIPLLQRTLAILYSAKKQSRIGSSDSRPTDRWKETP